MQNMILRLLGEDIRLETTYARDLPLIGFDRRQIEQIILNLAINSRDAMPKGGRLTIKTGVVQLADGRTGVLLPVSDDGVGIPAEVRTHAHGTSILLVEDHSKVAAFAKTVLESLGHVVHAFPDGESAVNTIAARGIWGEGLTLLVKPYSATQLATRLRHLLEEGV